MKMKLIAVIAFAVVALGAGGTFLATNAQADEVVGCGCQQETCTTDCGCGCKMEKSECGCKKAGATSCGN